MPVAFLTELEARRWGRFGGEPTIEQLDRFFHLDADDLRRARRHRGESTVLGFAVQVGTLRFLGTFLAQVEGTPRGVISYVGHQLGVGPEAWTGYPSSRARELHTTEIRNLYGYTAFGDGRPHWRFLRWMVGRAWAADEPPSQLLDTATGWLVDNKVVLPGVSTPAGSGNKPSASSGCPRVDVVETSWSGSSRLTTTAIALTEVWICIRRDTRLLGSTEPIVSRPILGGLHHVYSRAA